MTQTMFNVLNCVAWGGASILVAGLYVVMMWLIPWSSGSDKESSKENVFIAHVIIGVIAFLAFSIFWFSNRNTIVIEKGNVPAIEKAE